MISAAPSGRAAKHPCDGSTLMYSGPLHQPEKGATILSITTVFEHTVWDATSR